MLVHRRVTPSIKFAGTHLYTWVERGTVRVKCLAQEHNTMSPARARTGSGSGVELTNHKGGRLGALPTNSMWKKRILRTITDLVINSLSKAIFTAAIKVSFSVHASRRGLVTSVSTQATLICICWWELKSFTKRTNIYADTFKTRTRDC